ncbi:MAG: hypothetical protein TYPL_4900 [Candidatus Tyloplasma litorale]|nr:MAG: hypothetical protein TYPL_4900 [Mycoplasmatales bacterium]
MYIYYSRYNEVSKMFYPNLFNAMNEYENAIKNAIKNDPYYEVYEILEFKRDKKRKSIDFLMESRDYLNKLLEKNNISIRKLSKASNIKYSNLYNFLKKDKINAISVKNVHKALWVLWAFVQGWTLEEAKEKHIQKFKEIWLHWNIDGIDINIENNKDID